MKKIQLSIGLGMMIALVIGVLGLFSFTGAAYMDSGVSAPFNMDWGMLGLNIAAWILVSYVALSVYERIRG